MNLVVDIENILMLTRQKLVCAVAVLIFFLINSFSFGQSESGLSLYNEEKVAIEKDWLVQEINDKAEVYRTKDDRIVLSNGLISRTFSIDPNGATVGFKNLMTGRSLLRSVRPEARVQLDGANFDIGGLTGQPIHNYLLPKWLDQMQSVPGAWQLDNYSIGEPEARFGWDRREEWMPDDDLPWPAPGVTLTFRYKATDKVIGKVIENRSGDSFHQKLIEESFEDLGTYWNSRVSSAHPRNSLVNEGKPGEIMALENTAVFTERPLPEATKVVVAQITPGTDKSASWGPGMALVFTDEVIKLNLRPGSEQFGIYDGKQERTYPGMQEGETAYLRMEVASQSVKASYSYDGDNWTDLQTVPIAKGQRPQAVRLGKMDPSGGFSDYKEKGSRIRCRIESFKALGSISEKGGVTRKQKYAYLKDISVNIHYQMYDGIPLLSKWMTVENNSDRKIKVDRFTNEILAATEPESSVGVKEDWMLPNITVETDYAFGGGMNNTASVGKSVFWEEDPLYKTQVNYQRKTPVLLNTKPQYGPAQRVPPGDVFTSFRTWELVHDSRDRERKGLAQRKMYRTIAPWITENPIIMHVRQADTESVKKAINQSAEVGFEMVIMTFGSGFNIEDTSEKNLQRMEKLAQYADSQGVALGGYSLLASRSVGGGNDVVMPEGMTPRFGNSPCLQSQWGQEYFETLYDFFQTTGQDVLEHDGSYPGDVCAATDHVGHKGLSDSQWKQFEKISTFYQWARSQGIYLNVPDWYFLNGSNKTGMGYRETNWSLPRKQQEIIERQNVYDGTWEKTPSMGWMFVPLTEYHGGGEAATIEPLKEHLPHYEQRLANLFGAGVQATYRGPRLYDSPETKTMVKKWVDFYKKHRAILDSDIIHLRRPDGRDWDGILHVNPDLENKGLAMIYNPLGQPISRTLTLPLYYTGLTETARIRIKDGLSKTYHLNREYEVEVPVEIEAHGVTWLVIE